jgi:hypothetical protein
MSYQFIADFSDIINSQQTKTYIKKIKSIACCKIDEVTIITRNSYTSAWLQFEVNVFSLGIMNTTYKPY